MTRPCGACKFLRRKCIKGCVLAPYFSHEQGSTHFSAIHKVFGASNVSKLLAHLPIDDRLGAAVTIAYEAQARVQDPIYGCVSHIFALQQQVVYLQAQVAFLREQAAQCIINSSNPSNLDYDHKFYSTSSFLPQDFSIFLQNQITMPQLEEASHENFESMDYFALETTSSNPNHAKNENPVFEEKKSLESMDSPDLRSSNDGPWMFLDDADDLQSVAFRYIKH